MCFQLKASDVLYQHSKFAPRAVVRLALELKPGVVELDPQQLETLLGSLAGNAPAATGPFALTGSPAEIYCSLVLALQRYVGHEVSYSRAEEHGSGFRVFIEYEDAATALYAAELAQDLLNTLVHRPGDLDSDGDQVPQAVADFEAFARARRLDPDTRLLRAAARKRAIPVMSLDQPWGLPVWPGAAPPRSGVTQYGWGVNQQRCRGALPLGLYSRERLQQVSDRAGWLARLKAAGLPLVGQDLEFLNRNQVTRAQRSARRIGYPVVVRSRHALPFSRGADTPPVWGPLWDDAQVARAVQQLRDQAGAEVWVESFVHGDRYRFLLLNHQLVSVIRPADQEGGRAEGGVDVPSRFVAVVREAAAAAGLQPLAEIELTLGDLQGAAAAPNCVVSGVAPVPGLAAHSAASTDPEALARRYFDLLFPGDRPARIPTVAITGTNGKTTTCRMVTRILQAAGYRTGLSCSDGVYIDDELLLSGDESGVLGANEVLAHPQMEAAVLETARGNLAIRGIAFEHCDVAACLNVAEDHLGLEGIDTLDAMAVHKRQVVERATQAVVLNAEDPRCLAMREHTVANEVILVARSAGHPAIQAHVQSGGRAVVLAAGEAGQVIALADPQGVVPLMAVNQIPATFDGKALFNVDNALCAVAICHVLGVAREQIIAGLSAFRMGVDTTPGRMNELTGLPFRVIVDAAHNPHGFRLLAQYADQLTTDGKKVVVFGAKGTLSNTAIQEMAELAAGHFRIYVVTNYAAQVAGGRSQHEIPELLKERLIRQGVPELDIIVESSKLDAVERGLELTEAGDLLVIQVKAGGDDKWDTINKVKAAADRYN